MQQALTGTQRKIQLPDWVPARTRSALAGREVSFDLPRQVKLRLRQPEKMRVSEWAEKHRRVTDGAHVGAWHHDYAPHSVKIMDTFGLPWVREVWMCAVEQSAKTAIMINCMGWAVDCDPGNIFYFMPTESTAGKIMGEKIRPAFQKSPRLARYLSAKQDDTSLTKISMAHGISILPAWANSPTSMATFAAKHCFGDEVDKYPVMAGREADPITLIKKRNRTYRGRFKRFFSSTPAGLYIYKGMQACHQVWERRVTCPDCGELVRMDAEHLVLPEGATAESIERTGVEYACNACGSAWDDTAREHAIRTGRWVCVKGADIARPAKVGFHLRAWECLDIPLTEIAAAYLAAKTGSTSDKVAWANGYEATDYVEEHQERKEDHILRLVDKSMPRAVVPRGTSTILVLADTQAVGFYYQIWAYGWGRDLETWRIDHGYVEHFDHLADIAARDWQDADGKDHRALCGFIDSGGGTDPMHPKHSRTAEVYEFCRRNPFFRPLKGRREQSQPWNTTRIDYYPSRQGKKVPIPGGLVLYTINVTVYKSDLARKLQIEPGDPGAFHLHAEMGEDYAKQMCAEYQDERGWWLCPKNKANHHWDIAVYGMAAADILRIKDKRQQEENHQPQRRVISRGVTA